MGAPWGGGGWGGGGGGIDPNTHRTISGRCHEDTSRSWLEDYPRYSVMVPIELFLVQSSTPRLV